MPRGLRRERCVRTSWEPCRLGSGLLQESYEDGLGWVELGGRGNKNNFFFLMFDLEWRRQREWGEYRIVVNRCKAPDWTTKLIYRTIALIAPSPAHFGKIWVGSLQAPPKPANRSGPAIKKATALGSCRSSQHVKVVLGDDGATNSSPDMPPSIRTSWWRFFPFCPMGAAWHSNTIPKRPRLGAIRNAAQFFNGPLSRSRAK